MKTGIRGLPGLYDHRRGTEDTLTGGLTVAEMYHWAPQKRAENLLHRSLGHEAKYGFCAGCDNCLCGLLNFTPLKSFVCRCESARKQLTPYRVRFKLRRDHDGQSLLHQVRFA